MKYIAHIVVTLLAITLAANAAAAPQAVSEKAAQKAVLVTGASSGIGRKITDVLAASGHFVYATARKQKDLDELNKIENVQAIRLDVTRQEEIDAAVAAVKAGGRGLYGLVNNAGVYSGGPLVEIDLSELQWVMDVNVFGPFRVTKAFAPLIIEGKGRITTIGSISGILTGPFSGPYSMSKHAVEAYTDALAHELARFDVQVSVIEPGNYRSKIAINAGKRMAEMGFAEEGSLYKEEIERIQKLGESDRSQYKEPDEVAAAVMHALFDAEPNIRYMVVPEEREAGWTINKAITEMVQLNEWQAYSYSRDELIEMLDQAIGTD